MFSSLLAPARATGAALRGIAASALLAIPFVSGLAGDAHTQTQTVGLTARGAVDTVGGYPLYYEDANGLRLQLCQDPNLCLFALPNPALPLSFPANYPDEQFYWAVAGDMAAGNASLAYENALEAAFTNGVVVNGEQVVFTRFRLRASGLSPSTNYTVTWPYGNRVFTTDNTGGINFTDDIGFTALQFNLALNGNVGPFLTPVGFTSRAPGTYIADVNSLVAVQGSPLGTNYFRIVGPGVGNLFSANRVDANTAQINLFNLQGQISTTGGVGVQQAYIARAGTQTAVNVWATAPTGAALMASAGGSAAVPMVALGTTGTYFARVLLAAAAVPTSVTITNTTDNPPTVFTQNGLSDLVQVRSAIYTVDGALAVTGFTSDKLNNPVLTLSGAGLTPVAMTSTGSGLATSSVAIAPGAAVPDTVTVTSALGGVATVPVSVELSGIVPVFANAGVDQSVAAGAAVSLNGSTSTGPVTTYAWTHDAGAAITVTGANTATPSFTAPTLSTASVITFTLTVGGSLGQTSTDTMVVNVAAANAPTANAGADRTVAVGTAVTLSGAASTGTIQSYAWTQTAGTAVTLTGANTATATFTAPTVTVSTPLAFRLTVTGVGGLTSFDDVVVTVSPVVDTIAITAASYRADRREWNITGTATLRQGQTITVYLGAAGDTSRPVGTATVTATGTWSYVSPRNQGVIPLATDTTVWARSSLGGNQPVRTFTRR